MSLDCASSWRHWVVGVLGVLGVLWGALAAPGKQCSAGL